MVREKDLHLKMFKRLTTTVKNIEMTGPVLKKQLEELEMQLEEGVNEEKYLTNQLEELKKEIDVALYDFLKIDKLDKTEMDTAKYMQSRNRELEIEIDKLKKKSREMIREADTLKMEMDLKV